MLTDIRALADHFLIALPNINRDLLYRGMVHSSWAGRLLLLGVGTFLSKVPHLVAVVARSLCRIVGGWCCSLNCLWLGGSYCYLVRLLLRGMPSVPSLRRSEPSTWGRRTILPATGALD